MTVLGGQSDPWRSLVEENFLQVARLKVRPLRGPEGEERLEQCAGPRQASLSETVPAEVPCCF